MKRNLGIVGLVCSGALFLLGCGGASAQAGGTSFESTAPTTASDQVALGQKLYGKYCAECHGANGEGAKGPPVVGKSALPLDPPPGAKHRTMQFHTAADVFTFVKANMPANAPGSLTDAEYAAILAFDLKANGVTPGKMLDPQVAAGIVLHP